MEKFRKLGIIAPLLKAIEEQGFKEPTDIQEKSIPIVLTGADVIAGAATGSGKTLVFASSIVQNAFKGRGIQALILVPTRELAEQVSRELRKFSKYRALHVIPVYGGVSINPQISNLRTADVVVATPGRLIDHLQRNTVNLNKVNTLVLDEADRMLDMGFIHDVEVIIRKCPQNRQTLLFSATISDDIVYLTRNYMKKPIRVSVESYVDPKKLKQVYYNVQDNLKFSLLVHLLKHEQSGLVMVFCNTQKSTDFVANNLKALGIEALAIHGGHSQEKRTHVMNKFNSEKVFVLVCTDVASRGLDIKGVSHVYNFDIPKESKQYIHRIGRTARAGAEGKAINILGSKDYDNFSSVLRNNDVQIKKEETPRIEFAKISWKPFTNRRPFQRGSSHSFSSRSFSSSSSSRRGAGTPSKWERR